MRVHGATPFRPRRCGPAANVTPMQHHAMAVSTKKQVGELLPDLRELDHCAGDDGRERRAAVRSAVGYDTYWILTNLVSALSVGTCEAQRDTLSFLEGAAAQGSRLPRSARGQTPDEETAKRLVALARRLERLIRSDDFVAVSEELNEDPVAADLRSLRSCLLRLTSERAWREAHGLSNPRRPFFMRLDPPR